MFRLINAMLNKDPSRRPSSWDLANFPIIQEKIEKYFTEEAKDDVFLRTKIYECNLKREGIN